jgi:hypothetical protein
VRDGQTEIATLDLDRERRTETTCADDLCHGTSFDGRRLSTFGINGSPLPQTDDDATERTLAAIESTAFGETSFVAGGGRVEALPDAGGKMRLRVTAAQGADLIAVADRRTSRLLRVEQIDGSILAELIPTTAGTTTIYATRPYDGIVATQAPFAMPTGPHVSFRDEPSAQLASATLPVIACRVESRPARCLLDSGTTPSAVTLEFAEGLGREPRGRIEIGAFAPYLTGAVACGPVAVGGASFERLELAVIPRLAHADFDVILGSDALAMLGVEFAFDQRRVSVGPARSAPAGTALPLELRDGRPYLPVRLGPNAPEPMLLDTGDAGTLSIGYDEYREDATLFAPHGASTARGVNGGPMDAVEGVLAHVDVGGLGFDQVPISAVRGQHGGHVGFSLAARCRRFELELGRGSVQCVAADSTGTPPPRDLER